MIRSWQHFWSLLTKVRLGCASMRFDFVVDADGNVQIIEINHRSNYAHPKLMENKVDVPLLKNLYKLLIQGSSLDTDFRKV